MKSKDFIEWFNSIEKRSMGIVSVEPQKEIFKQFSIGCFFDEETKTWKVYENDERTHNIMFETESEDKAYEELQSMVIFEQRNNRGYY